jgi:integrase
MEYVHADGETYDVQWQLHARTRKLEIPKHNSRRKIFLPDDVRAEMEAARGVSGEGERYIWLNGRCDPWHGPARQKWWTKQVDGTSLAEQAGGITMYQATRHFWASWAVNEGGISPYIASVLMGHSDGGQTLIRHYLRKDQDHAVQEALRASMQARQPGTVLQLGRGRSHT